MNQRNLHRLVIWGTLLLFAGSIGALAIVYALNRAWRLAEPPGDQIRREPEKLEDIKTYARNLALWLAG